MPKHTIPLILPATARGWATSIGTSAKDQQLINGLYQVSSNALAGSKAVYVQKRSGSTTSGTTITSGIVRIKHYSSDIGILYASAGTLYLSDATNLGTFPSNQLTNGFNRNQCAVDAIIGSKAVIAFNTNDGGGTGSGWFLYSDSYTSTFPTFSGNRTSGSAVIDGIASTTGIYKGQAISGTGIPADTRVLSVDSGVQITMSANATSGASTATTITKEALAKITDSDFPSNPIAMAYLDGYFFAADERTGDIYQSSINDPSAWAASDKLNADYAGDHIRTMFRWQDNIVVPGTRGTVQYFYNAGNASGSVLSTASHLNLVGLVVMTPPLPLPNGGYCICAKTGDIGETAEGLYSLTGANTFTPVSDDLWSQIITDGDFDLVGQANSGNKPLILVHGGSSEYLVAYDTSTDAFSILSMSAAITSSFRDTFTKTGVATPFSWSDNNTWTDSSAAYTLTAQSEPIYLGGDHGGTDISFELIADTEASGTATLDVSDDDYASWRTVGAFDMTKAKKILWGGGWHSGPRAYRVTHSANTNFRAQALVIEWR